MASTNVAQGLLDDDDHDAIMTICRHAGSFDAELFAMELQHMYIRYAERHHWNTTWQVTMNRDDAGEYQQEATIQVAGSGAYVHLKHEGGTHRVQRIPVGAPMGRIHTATVKVIVLPVVASEAQIAPLHAGAWDEKIRTYHYSQQRVTDHRINLSVYDLPSVLDGNLDVFSDALRNR